MKTIKYLLLSLLIAALCIFIYFSLQSGSYSTDKSKTIEAPISLAAQQLQDLNKWQEWSDLTVVSQDSANRKGVNTQITLADSDGEEFTISLDSVSNNRYIYKINHATEVGKVEEDLRIVLEGNKDSLNISFDRSGELDLFQKIKATLFSADLENQVEVHTTEWVEGFSAYLDTLSRKHSITPLGRTELASQYYLYTSTGVTLNNLDTSKSDMLKSIRSFMQSNKIKADGEPFIIYERNRPPSRELIVSVAIPVRDRVVTPDDSRILGGFRAAAQVIKVELKGSSKRFRNKAWTQAAQYATDNGYRIENQIRPIEVIEISADDTPNPAEQLSFMYLPISSGELPQAEETANQLLREF